MHASGNTIKTVLLLGLLSALLIVGGQAFGGRNGIYMGLVFAVVMNFAGYFFSDKIALATYSAQPVTETENPEVYRRVAPIVRESDAAHGAAHAEAVGDCRGFAQRVCHRPQPGARFGGVHRRAFCR